MNKYNQVSKRNVGLVGAICGSLLIGIPLSPLPGLAEPSTQNNQTPCTCQQTADNRVRTPGNRLISNQGSPTDTPTTSSTVLNPRPSIFNEPPYNRVGTSTTAPAVSPAAPDQTNPPVQPPLPEQRSQPIARVMPIEGKVDVRLKNNTNALITYEAIGYTQRRTLAGGEETVLRLPTPVTVTMLRQDKGLLNVIPSSTQQGLLEVSLDEDKSLDNKQGTLRIQSDGQVFLN